MLSTGPVNKAAIEFARVLLASTVSTGGLPVMAAVVPPLAVFVATLLSKDKFLLPKNVTV